MKALRAAAVAGSVLIVASVGAFTLLPDDEPTYFATCADAREAGVTPLRESDPGYAPHLDGDGDGLACE